MSDESGISEDINEELADMSSEDNFTSQVDMKCWMDGESPKPRNEDNFTSQVDMKCWMDGDSPKPKNDDNFTSQVDMKCWMDGDSPKPKNEDIVTSQVETDGDSKEPKLPTCDNLAGKTTVIDECDGSGGLVADIESKNQRCDDNAVDTSDVVEGVTAVTSGLIDSFSARLAETVVQEAILINEIHDRDKLNSDVRVGPRLGQRLEPVTADGVVSPGGYDNYLIDKLLRSEADPNELVTNDSEGDIDGQVVGDRYPGLDPSDNYVREELDSARKDTEISDQNNNQMNAAMLDGYGDTLQTIHEGLELDLHVDLAVKEETGPVEVNVVTINGLHEPLPATGDTEPITGDGQTDAHIVDESGNDGDAESNGEGETDPTEVGATLPLKGILKVRQEEQRTAVEGQTPEEPSVPEEGVGEGEQKGEEEEEEEEEEGDCCEMTTRQKQRLVDAVREGDIERLQKLMLTRNASLDIQWYGENLLTIAVRAGQEDMAFFLIDNGVNWRYKTRLVEKTDTGIVKIYSRSLRQLAYEQNLMEIVTFIDYKTNHVFPFTAPPRERTLELLEPLVPFEPPPLSGGELLFSEEYVDENVFEDGGKGDKQMKTKTGSDKDVSKRKAKDGKHSNNDNNMLPLRSTSNSSHKSSSDDLTQVFGPDLGYEVTSPISKYMNGQRNNSSSSLGRDTQIVGGTRSFHLMKAHNSKYRETVDPNSDYPMQKVNAPVGSYNFEKRQWSVVRSAPASYNYSEESIPDAFVRVGLPFVHGDRKMSSRSLDVDRQNSRRSRSAKSTSSVSPYDKVAKLLSENKLLVKNNKNRHNSDSSVFPSISGKQNTEFSTRINYIYANRGSPDPHSRLSASYRFPSHNVKAGIKLDVLPKRKVTN